MIFIKAIIFLCFFICEVRANHWTSLQSGDQTAQDLLNQLNTKKTEAEFHPFYNGQTPSEANFTNTDLVGRPQSAAQHDSASQMVQESASARAQFKIDPQTDPLLIQGQKIIETLLTEIGGKDTNAVEIAQAGQDETLICEEPGDPSLETCIHELKVTIKKTKIRKEWKGTFQFSKCCNAERRSHYQPCGALRQAVSEAACVLRMARKSSRYNEPPPIDPKTALNITNAYKACMSELAGNPGRSCNECNTVLFHPSLRADQIKDVILETHPHDPYDLHLAHHYWHVYKSGRDEYNIQYFFKIIYEEENVEVLPDEWVSNCDRLEEKDDQGLCSYESKVCTQGPQTRLIDGVPITRDCWQYTLTYACSVPTQDDCGPLRARGCVQLDSTCKQYVGNNCVVYSQTYQCKGNKQTRFQITGGQTPFCLDGNCRDQSWEANDEMMSTLAQLSLLKEMEGKFEGGFVFKGEDKRCAKWIFKFIDCCGSGSGWGKDIGFAKCKPPEKELREKRKRGLCHYIGTYCDKKVLGKCVKKQASYCCFSNKLLKAFHEQGRAQIGMGWGEPKHPLCRGFTIDEIQRIDFSKLDLREIFEDLMKNFNPGKMQDMGKQVGDRLEIIKKGLTPNIKQQSKQRDEA